MPEIERKRFQRALIRTTVIPVAIMSLVLAFLVWQVERLLANNQAIENSTQVVSQVRNTEKLLIDMETGLRGFIITADPEFLSPYKAADPQIDQSLSMLRQLLSNDTDQIARIDRVAAGVNDWKQYVAQSIASRGSLGPAELEKNVLRGKQKMDVIRGELSVLLDHEQANRTLRIQLVNSATNKSLLGAGLFALLAGLVLGSIGRRELRGLSKRYENAIRQAKERSNELTISENKYKAFIERSSEGIWRIEMEQPFSIRDPEDVQLDHFYKYAYLAECNDAMARMYGFERAADLVGARLGDLLMRDDPINEEYLRSFIRSGYRLIDAESVERDREGNRKYFLNNLVGVIENEAGIRAWGTQRDITERKGTQQGLAVLVEASVTLLKSPDIEVVIKSLLELAQRLISADAYALWNLDEVAGGWRALASSGLSDAYLNDFAGTHGSTSTIEEPLVAPNVESEKQLELRRVQYEREGIKSLLVVPLKMDVQGRATLAFYHRKYHQFSEHEVSTSTALGSLAASAIGTARLYSEQTRMRREAEASERRSEFLAEAATMLASSLDYQRTLASVAQLAVPRIADWCAIDILDESGTPVRIVTAHANPDKVKWAEELHSKYPESPDEPGGIYEALRTGVSKLYTDISDEMIEAAARSDEHLSVMRNVGFTSAMIVPLKIHDNTLGVVTFVSAESGQHYQHSDLVFAEDLAYRAAAAVENARLFANAQEANRIKDEFLATLSHELRTPMTAIMGWTHLLKNNILDDEGRKRALETIERNAQSQTQIIEDILDVSRIITGKINIAFEQILLTPIIEDVVQSMMPVAEARGVVLTQDIEPGNFEIFAGRERFRQILWNLLSNALKFTPSGGRVTVSLTATDDSTLRIEVSDTGEGIEEEFLPYVFDRFRQADGSTTRRHGGLGLGLSIVRHLVELHGGTISAESEGRGHGAKFTIILPRISEEATERKSKSGSLTANGTSTRLLGHRVLVVDDDEDARQLINTALKFNGAVTFCASNAEDALNIFQRWKPDVLLSDIGMPLQDGYELIRKIRSLPEDQGGRTPAAALTAYATDGDQQKALDAGFQVHLAKPINIDELIQTVEFLLTHAKAS